MPLNTLWSFRIVKLFTSILQIFLSQSQIRKRSSFLHTTQENIHLKLNVISFSAFCIYRGVSRRLTVWMGKRSACSFPIVAFGDDGFPFKAKIRTILENFPKWLFWSGSYIYFGRKVLNDFVYYQ